MSTASKIKVWSLAHSCQRLATKVKGLVTERSGPGGEQIDVVEWYLEKAASILTRIGEPEALTPQSAYGFVPVRNGGPDGLVVTGARPHKQRVHAGEDPPSDDHRVGFRAQAGLVPTPDLITFLASEHLTGILEVRTADERYTLEFQDGDIVHAQSDRTPDGSRLGDLLIEQGAITRDALEAALRTRTHQKLGVFLIENEHVTPRQMLAALEVQIRRLFQRLFEARPTDVVFWDGPPIEAERSMRLNATALILDGARACDESAHRSPQER